MGQEKEDWSEQDKRINELTGFKPAERSKRKCTICGKAGHYYYECNNGSFLKMADGLVEGLKMMPDSDNNRPPHHADCCCQFNPIVNELDIVGASMCCPVHNFSPEPCFADPKCCRNKQ